MHMHEPFSERPEISAFVARDLKSFAAQLGIDIDPFADAIGIDTSVFGMNEARLPIDKFARLLEALATVTDDETFGARYALGRRVGAGGFFEYGLRNAPTLGEALSFIDDNVVVFVDVVHKLDRTDANYVRFEWGFSPLITVKNQLVDFTFQSLLGPMAAFGLDQAAGVVIDVNRSTPKSPAGYRALFPRRVAFERQANAISVQKRLISQTNPNADPKLYELMAWQCRTIAETRTGRASIVDQARELLLEGRGQAASLPHIARRLGLSPRSFQRRLSEMGTSFQEIFDETRREASDRLLRDTDLTIGQISDRLGFSAPSAYSRSAARWYGRSPSRVRDELRRREALDAAAMSELAQGAKTPRNRR